MQACGPAISDQAAKTCVFSELSKGEASLAGPPSSSYMQPVQMIRISATKAVRAGQTAIAFGNPLSFQVHGHGGNRQRCWTFDAR